MVAGKIMIALICIAFLMYGCAQQNTNCDDGNACTVDSYDPSAGCKHEAITCDDGDVCTVDSCDPAIGCVYALKNCDDGNPAKADSCDSETGECIHTPTG